MKNIKGYTLTEILIAGTVSVAALAAALTFFVQSTLAAYRADQKYKLSTISRSITSELMQTAALANLIVLYRSSLFADRDTAADRLAIDTTPTPWLRPSGNMAVFVFFESPKPNEVAGVPLRYHRIRRIVGYYAQARPDNGFSFRRIDIDFMNTVVFSGTPRAVPEVAAVAPNPATIDPNYLERIIDDNWTRGAVRILHDNVRGLSLNEVDVTDTTPRIFYYNNFRTVTLNMQMFASGDGAININSGSRNTVSTSINFTLTPRT